MEKLVIISTKGPSDPEIATIAFVMATAALATDIETTVILQSDAVWISKKGEAPKINAQGFMPLQTLLENFITLGGKLLLCSPCLNERGITSNDIIQGAQTIAAGTVIDEAMSAKTVMTY